MSSVTGLAVPAPVQPLLDRTAVENARSVRAARDRLLTQAGAVTLAMLAEGRRSSANAARQWVHRHRTGGSLITVEHDGNVLVPTFQLDDAFDLDKVVAEAVQRLVVSGMSPWAVWHWFYAESGWIGEPPIVAARRRDVATLDRAVRRLVEA